MDKADVYVYNDTELIVERAYGSRLVSEIIKNYVLEKINCHDNVCCKKIEDTVIYDFQKRAAK